MRTADLKLGDKVVIGRKDLVKRGRKGQVVYVIARGNFREAYTPCGKAILPSPKSDARVVVAVEQRDGTWRPELKHSSSLYSYEEFRLAEGEYKKRLLEAERWQTANQKWLAKLDRQRKYVLGIDVWDDVRYVKKPKEKWGQNVDVRVCDFDALLKVLTGPVDRRQLANRVAQLRQLEKDYTAWLAATPDPTKCRLP